MIIEQLVNLSGVNKINSYDFTALTFPYNKQAVLLVDLISMGTKAIVVSAGKAFNKSIPFPCPLVGFEYNYESDIPFIINEYSEYPYLNKQLLVEGAITQNADFSLTIHNLITEINPYTVKEVKNKLLVDGLTAYVRNGGTFAVMTPWGDIDLCVLKGLYGVRNEVDQVGISYRAEFKKLTPVRTAPEQLYYKLASYITGAIL